MERLQPSRTALRVALRRAAHQIYDSQPLVFDDPFAVPLLGATYRDELRRTPQRADRPHSIGLRAWLVARSRFAEDSLAAAVTAGVTQYVVLGAGLDTFGLRNPHPLLRVFEVDHPATQMWKQTLLAAGRLELPPSVHLIPVDFERDRLGDALRAGGFQAGVQTMFSWLGVVPYLTLAGFRATLRLIAASPPGSEVVLDYGQPRSVLPAFEQAEHDSLASRVRLAGEPFQLFLTEAQMADELGHFNKSEDLGRDALNARYFAGRTDSLQILRTAPRLVRARV